jgi:DNA-cytosine methyltransferase
MERECMFKVLDLFCGAGGFSYGLEKLNEFKVKIGLDFNEYAIETFKHAHEEVVGIVGDITDINVKSKIVQLCENEKVNMIIGGPPCQGFSLKGKKLGLNDPRNFLFKEFLDIVEKVMPEVVVIENVKNLINSSGGYFIKEITSRIEKLGYFVNYSILNANNYGVPQKRERAIIICSLSHFVNMPEPHTSNKPTVRDAISDLAYLNSGEGSKESLYLTDAQSDYQSDMRNRENILYDHKATNHSEHCLTKLGLIPPEGDKSSLPVELHGKQKFSTTWSRLIWDKPSPTIDTRFDTPSNGRNSHPFLQRAITPREAARLQSFDDSFKFFGTKGAICKQIGNAVPPLLAKAIGVAIVEAYKKEKVSIQGNKLYNMDSIALAENYIRDGKKVDHIITDPPYNISKMNNFSTLRTPRKGVDFGEWDKDFNLVEWIPKYSEILSKDGSMIVFCSYRFISFLIESMENNGMVVKDVIVWQKTNPMPRNRDRRYVQDMEFAIWAVKKKSKWVFNRLDRPYVRSLYSSSTVAGKERTKHPTQKSLKLMEEIIRTHTLENETIIDPFMGSGTTGVAAIRNNRKFIGCEISKEYYEIAVSRIEHE